MSKILHFAIGPVKSFVAQSRRTRDLMASSFLLSYLSGQAMHCVLQNGGKILFPFVDHDPLMKAIREKKQTKNTGPWIGTLPNRFKAEVPIHFDPKQVKRAIFKAWRQIANAVWDYLELDEFGEETAKIWNRQISHFWEINWVIGEDRRLLDQRKCWRSFIPSVESGEKCYLIPHLQDISGESRKKGKLFWRKMAEKLEKKRAEINLSEEERLSEIALIKRFFPMVAKEAIGWSFPKEAIYFPSTSELSTLLWKRNCVDKGPQQAKAYVNLLTSFPEFRVSHRQKIFPKIMEGLDSAQSSIFYVTGHPFYRHTLEKAPLSEEKKKELFDHYESLIQKVGQSPQGYFAVLMMDGDGLGSLLQSGIPGDKISQSISRFTDGLEKLIQNFHGVPIYAGGDDVLVIVPKETVLPLSVALREKYMQAFHEINQKEKNPIATISGAIIYAHYTAALKNVIQSGHRLLDEVAKDQTGRDSLAIQVLWRSGNSLVWSAPWEVIIEEKGEKPVTIFEDLVEQFQTEKGELTLTNQFIYKLAQVYEEFPFFHERMQYNRRMFKRFMVSEYQRRQDSNKKFKTELVEAKIEKLMRICFRSWRDEHRKIHVAEGEFSAHGALLIPFLARSGDNE